MRANTTISYNFACTSNTSQKCDSELNASAYRKHKWPEENQFRNPTSISATEKVSVLLYSSLMHGRKRKGYLAFLLTDNIFL